MNSTPVRTRAEAEARIDATIAAWETTSQRWLTHDLECIAQRRMPTLMTHPDYCRLVARAQADGRNARETLALVFDPRAVDDASADALLAEARQVRGVFEVAARWGGLAEQFDLRQTCENCIVNRIPIAEVRREILAKAAELSPHIDTAPRGRATRGDGLATTGAAGDINAMARKRYNGGNSK